MECMQFISFETLFQPGYEYSNYLDKSLRTTYPLEDKIQLFMTPPMQTVSFKEILES